jgi:hypothetical protein
MPYDMRSSLPLFGALGLGGMQSPQQPGGMQAMIGQLLQTLHGAGGSVAMPQLGHTAPAWTSIWPNSVGGPTGQPPVGGMPPAVVPPVLGDKPAQSPDFDPRFYGWINSSGGGGQ